MPEVDEPIILLAEDNEDDVIMFCRAFKDVGYRSALQLVRHGDEVVAYLSGAGKFANRAEYERFVAGSKDQEIVCRSLIPT